MIFYIHGFNSSGNTTTIELLRKQLNKHVEPLFYESGDTFQKNISSLLQQFDAKSDGFNLLIGTSLGGFYAIVMSAITLTPCVVFNPVTQPREQLNKFLGHQKNYVTGEEYDFTHHQLYSYPEDLNYYNINVLNVPMKVYCSKNDLVLKNNIKYITKEFDDYEILNTDKHRIDDFSPFIDTIIKYENFFGLYEED